MDNTETQRISSYAGIVFSYPLYHLKIYVYISGVADALTWILVLMSKIVITYHTKQFLPLTQLQVTQL